jgi:glycosyltransferase 2 family protein
MKGKLRVALGLLLSLLFLFLAMRGIDWEQLGQLFRQADYVYLIAAFVLIGGLSWVRALRWRLLAQRDPGADLPTLFHLVNIGYFFNNILPAKAGEVVRVYLSGRRFTGGYGQAASTLLVERLLDVLSVVMVLVLLLPVIDIPDWARQGGLLFGAAAIGGTMALLIIAQVGTRAVDWVWQWVGRIPLLGRPGVKATFAHLVDGFRVLLDWKTLPLILLTTAVIWFGYALLNYLMLLVFRLNALPFSAAALVLCATGFGMVLPSSPGAIGVFEWAGVQALAVFAVDQSTAFGYTLGLHLFTNLTLILLGIVGLVSQGLSYARISRVVSEGTATGDASTPVMDDTERRVEMG